MGDHILSTAGWLHTYALSLRVALLEVHSETLLSYEAFATASTVSL